VSAAIGVSCYNVHLSPRRTNRWLSAGLALGRDETANFFGRSEDDGGAIAHHPRAFNRWHAFLGAIAT
jgi:hypothetical protein